MKRFGWREIEEAIRYAKEGGQSLHCHRFIMNADAPKCFVDAVDRGEDIAHLFDQNVERLKETARKLGVNVILVEREGRESQHIDLCGRPLKAALKMCEKPLPLFGE